MYDKKKDKVREKGRDKVSGCVRERKAETEC